MQFDSDINPDRPVPALIGNGELVTALGLSGYHDQSEDRTPSIETQEFVIAGRRLAGPHHPLIPFGRLERRLRIDGAKPIPLERFQAIHTDAAEVRTRVLYERLLESTRTLITAHRNCLVAETRITNHSNSDVLLEWGLRYYFGARAEKRVPGVSFRVEEAGCGVAVFWETPDNLGRVGLSSDPTAWTPMGSGAALDVARSLGPGEEMVVCTVISFSDRIGYQEPLAPGELEAELSEHAAWWSGFWSQSEVVTGDALVDRFRHAALYALACQATPWSVPPSVSERHYGAGALHDEYYPFMALISGGWSALARRIPYFRLSTLPEAMRRAHGTGALYPWSSTEDGRERDPHGHWYTERFHLGQIAACAWTHWLYERSLSDLEQLYPVIRECAIYFEHHLLVRDDRGRLRTKACTDFDESPGAVEAGPFTMGAAVYALDRACEAARRLTRDRERRIVWDGLARELRQNFPVDLEERRYTLLGGKPLHSSIMGYVVPFFCDDGSEFAQNSVRLVYERAKTEHGWKPGFSEEFDGSSWMWTAGHLGMAAGVLGEADTAWDAVRRGPLSAGQFLSPNERLSAEGEPIVPWFTTGCAAWLAALHWMFARVDDTGDHLLPAVPESLESFRFRGLRLSRGVSAAVKVEEGTLIYLSLTAPCDTRFTFEVPVKFVKEVWPAGVGRIVDLEETWRIQVDLSAGENTLVEGPVRVAPTEGG
ncbi:MAG: hypothetical protein IH851_10400 [Armatimonadetes bacterium]|nr:hypothetical protein [Armatimonadota bacterium]